MNSVNASGRISQSVKSAFKSIRRNKFRMFLTTLGIIIGVCAVISIISIARGTSASIEESMSALGAGAVNAELPGDSVSYEELQKFASDNSEIVKCVTPNMRADVSARRAERGSNDNSVTAIGTSVDYLTAGGSSVSSGRFINNFDISERRRVAVLGSYAASELFGNDNPIDKEIRLSGEYFTVIGILDRSATTGMGGGDGSKDDVVIIPYTAGRVVFATNKIGNYVFLPNKLNGSEEIMQRLNIFLLNKTGNSELFSVSVADDMTDAAKGISDMLLWLIIAVSAVAMLVGGIGIMNVMLVSVTERKREIGIRKAVGATDSELLSQFVIESATISALGGIIGILLGIIISCAVGAFMGINAFPSWWVMLASFLFSALIGILFGFAPARRAAKLEPAEALRV